MRECSLPKVLEDHDFLDESKPEIVAPADPTWLIAVRAAESKKASDIKVLELTGVTSFADFFVICTGANSKQVQAIADEVGMQLKKVNEYPISVEGYNQAEWILEDYGDLLIHVFSTKAREYYGLERLWRAAKTVEIPKSAEGETPAPQALQS
ncbi:MAG TPA: ribosome silencing factor [Bryobacteraceae bacterium]|jgi:ribosome-associated protein